MSRMKGKGFHAPGARGELSTALVDLIARRPELRDVGIAGYLVGAAVDGGPGMPPKHIVIVFRGSEIVRSAVAA